MSLFRKLNIFTGEGWACFLLRLWIGMRCLLAGFDKFRSPTGEPWYHTDYYAKNVSKISENMANATLLTKPATDAFAYGLGYALIIVGIWVLVGFLTRLALIAAGLLFVSLAYGLMMLPDDHEALFLGIHVGLVALALGYSKHNTLAVDSLFGLFKLASSEDEKAAAGASKN